MAKKNLKATESEATKVANKSEEFFNKHKKLILGGLGAILLIIVAIIGYKQFIVKPRELKANNALAKGQMMFGNPSDSVSLKTFLSVADEYRRRQLGQPVQRFGICPSGEMGRGSKVS